MAELETIARNGVAALGRGEAAAAAAAFETVAAAGRATPQLWLLLAQARSQLDERAAAHAALDQLLALDRINLDGLIMKGELFDRAGDDRAAVTWYDAALNIAPSVRTPLAVVTVAALRRAEAARTAAAARFTRHLYAGLAATGIDVAAAPSRFAEAIAIVAGTARPYSSAPTSFFYPRLASIPFFDPGDFAWMPAITAAVPAMRAEVAAVIATSAGLTPYVDRPLDRPAKEHSLLGDARWSAYHLWHDGALVAAHADACPATVAALAAAPMPQIASRSPMALFSILAGGTHIPPHNGMLNTRLICHIPLIVPRGCRLRVGNETRDVVAGVPLIFDDSIEHEAWNDSDEPRAVLLFEVWHPALDNLEQRALTAMFETIARY